MSGWIADENLAGLRLTIMAPNGPACPEWTWRSWSGRRFVDGKEHHGPIFVLGTMEHPARQNRTCDCCKPGATQAVCGCTYCVRTRNQAHREHYHIAP